MQMYNDRPQVETVRNINTVRKERSDEQNEPEDKSKIPQPEIFIIVEGKSIYKPGMKSVFVEADDSVSIGKQKRLTEGVYCTCNPVCTCESVPVCSCNAVRKSSSNGCSCNSQRGCSCAPVH